MKRVIERIAIGCRRSHLSGVSVASAIILWSSIVLITAIEDVNVFKSFFFTVAGLFPMFIPAYIKGGEEE